MGGGRKFHYPKYVWSPSGGWWNNPTHWKRNTVVAGVVLLAANAAVAYVSSSKERRSIAPNHHIPSQLWCKHAEKDDPSLQNGWGSK